MADYEGARPVRTAFDDELKGKVVDGKSGDAADRLVSVVRDNDSRTPATNDEGFPTMVLTGSDVYRVLKLTNELGQLRTDSQGTLFVKPEVESQDDTRVAPFFTATLDGKNGANPNASFEYPITDAKFFNGELLTVGARGQVKVSVQGSTDYDQVTPTWTDIYVFFQSPQDNPQKLIPAADGIGDAGQTVALRVFVENLEANASDVYVTLEGIESPV